MLLVGHFSIKKEFLIILNLYNHYRSQHEHYRYTARVLRRRRKHVRVLAPSPFALLIRGDIKQLKGAWGEIDSAIGDVHLISKIEAASFSFVRNAAIWKVCVCVCMYVCV